MSTRGVKSLISNRLAGNGGVLTAAILKEAKAYADKGWLTSGEKAALIQPTSYLADRGISITRIEPAAMEYAKQLGTTFGLVAFPNHSITPNPTPTNPTPTAPRNDVQAATEALRQAKEKGQDLGNYRQFEVELAGGKMTFSTRWRNHDLPAMILTNPQWKDPSPRDVLSDNMTAFRAIQTVDQLKTFLTEVTTREAAHFAAEGVDVRWDNEKFGVQGMRREAFFNAVRSQLAATGLSNAAQAASGHVLLNAEESLKLGRDYNMDVGSHTNYWPYWNNYADFLVKLAEQAPKGSDDRKVIENRLRDIYSRKTVFSQNREINERDFESSVNGALIYKPEFADGVGHRISLKEGSRSFDPKYELLTVATRNLPAELQQFAGAQVVRDGDALKFDFMGDAQTAGKTGETIPAALQAHIRAQSIDDRNLKNSDLTIRKLESGERARRNISADWDGGGTINVAKILIGWWGHCHNEAPLNAMGVDPQKGVKRYVADRGVPFEAALKSYSAEDVWDVAGNLAADHESGYVSSSGQPNYQVENTDFVGNRNNGNHWMLLELGGRSGSLRIDAEVTQLWHKSDPTQQYDSPMARFRRDLPAGDGTFEPNPESIRAQTRDDDEITIDAAGRKMEVKVKYVTLDSAGLPTEREAHVMLDPTVDEAVKISEELLDRRPGGGGKVQEHWYNPKTEEHFSITQSVNESDNFERKEIDRTAPKKVRSMRSRQETTYDSVIDIHDFATANMGLPFTFDTSTGMAVWNYPVNYLRVDQDNQVEKNEGGQKFTYTTYTLKYDTMGGPSGEASYIIKRDEAGRSVRAVALDPMPDFAYRNDKMVAAPATTDSRGNEVLNSQAYEAGYMTDTAREILNTSLWESQAQLLFASLSDKTGGDEARVFIDEKGHMLSFANDADFQAAVDADKQLRELQAVA